MTGVICVLTAVGIAIGAGVWIESRSSAERRPHRPSSDAEVLARVPARALDLSSAVRARLRRKLRDDAHDLPAATQLARLEIEAARASGDPRFLGHAEAALAAWWEEERPPGALLLLRATIRQARHEFDAALADLDRLLAEAPDDEQALLTRAVVLGVLGRYAAGVESCGRLATRASTFVVAACRAPLLGVTGRARQAARELSDSMGAATSPGERAWGLSLLGEMARWMGDERAAEGFLRGALALRPEDAYTRGVLAELLRDGGRGDEAKAFASPVDERTRRELAREHWRSQREPADARVLLEAAAAADDRAAAAPVLAWLDETGFEWPRLRRLADQLRTAP
jgi:tetratricopeptide (TPR) repeat protein